MSTPTKPTSVQEAEAALAAFINRVERVLFDSQRHLAWSDKPGGRELLSLARVLGGEIQEQRKNVGALYRAAGKPSPEHHNAVLRLVGSLDEQGIKPAGISDVRELFNL